MSGLSHRFMYSPSPSPLPLFPSQVRHSILGEPRILSEEIHPGHFEMLMGRLSRASEEKQAQYLKHLWKGCVAEGCMRARARVCVHVHVRNRQETTYRGLAVHWSVRGRVVSSDAMITLLPATALAPSNYRLTPDELEEWEIKATPPAEAKADDDDDKAADDDPKEDGDAEADDAE